jgi:hypothetical protein
MKTALVLLFVCSSAAAQVSEQEAEAAHFAPDVIVYGPGAPRLVQVQFELPPRVRLWRGASRDNAPFCDSRCSPRAVLPGVYGLGLATPRGDFEIAEATRIDHDGVLRAIWVNNAPSRWVGLGVGAAGLIHGFVALFAVLAGNPSEGPRLPDEQWVPLAASNIAIGALALGIGIALIGVSDQATITFE